MRTLKVLVVLAGLVLLARYFPVIYYSTVFNDMVKQETMRARAAADLRRALLDKADLYFLPVKSEDIQIKETGNTIHIDVNYTVPVDLFVFTHQMTFHATAAGTVVR